MIECTEILGLTFRLVLQNITACVMVSVSYRSQSVSNFHSSLSTATKNCLMPSSVNSSLKCMYGNGAKEDLPTPTVCEELMYIWLQLLMLVSVNVTNSHKDFTILFYTSIYRAVILRQMRFCVARQL